MTGLLSRASRVPHRVARMLGEDTKAPAGYNWRLRSIDGADLAFAPSPDAALKTAIGMVGAALTKEKITPSAYAFVDSNGVRRFCVAWVSTRKQKTKAAA